jgi:hypothetical protein
MNPGVVYCSWKKFRARIFSTLPALLISIRLLNLYRPSLAQKLIEALESVADAGGA